MTYQNQYLTFYFFFHAQGGRERSTITNLFFLSTLYLQGIKKEAYGLRNITFSKSWKAIKQKESYWGMGWKIINKKKKYIKLYIYIYIKYSKASSFIFSFSSPPLLTLWSPLLSCLLSLFLSLFFVQLNHKQSILTHKLYLSLICWSDSLHYSHQPLQKRKLQ
jgi:hypothetical protein